MTNDHHQLYKYVGDETGTALERGTYRVVQRSVDHVTLEAQTTDPGEGKRVEITHPEWDNHLDTGMLQKVDG